MPEEARGEGELPKWADTVSTYRPPGLRDHTKERALPHDKLNLGFRGGVPALG